MREFLSSKSRNIQFQEIYKIESDRVVTWGKIAKDASRESLIEEEIALFEQSSWAFFDRVIDLLIVHDFCSECRLVIPLDAKIFVKKYHEICLMYDHFEEIRCLHIELNDTSTYLDGFENSEYIPIILNQTKEFVVNEKAVSCLHPQALSFPRKILCSSINKLHNFCQSITSTYAIPVIFRDIASEREFYMFQEIGAKYFSRAI
jgi:hypothetical protein